MVVHARGEPHSPAAMTAPLNVSAVDATFFRLRDRRRRGASSFSDSVPSAWRAAPWRPETNRPASATCNFSDDESSSSWHAITPQSAQRCSSGKGAIMRRACVEFNPNPDRAPIRFPGDRAVARASRSPVPHDRRVVLRQFAHVRGCAGDRSLTAPRGIS
jgi:hypothetical protein